MFGSRFLAGYGYAGGLRQRFGLPRGNRSYPTGPRVASRIAEYKKLESGSFSDEKIYRRNMFGRPILGGYAVGSPQGNRSYHTGRALVLYVAPPPRRFVWWWLALGLCGVMAPGIWVAYDVYGADTALKEHEDDVIAKEEEQRKFLNKKLKRYKKILEEEKWGHAECEDVITCIQDRLSELD